ELKPTEKLFKAARDHAANMASKRRIGHLIDGSGPGERLATVGYVSFGWAENCASGQETPAEAVQAWLNSPGHRANIFRQHAEIGVGVAAALDGSLYWVQVFANPGQ